MPIMHNPHLGDFKPVPSDPKAVMALQSAGYGRYELLVDTTLGTELPISIEGQNSSGQGVERCLAKKRRDEGHVGQPAFMLPEQWKRLSAEERAAFKPAGRSHGKQADLEAQVQAQADRIRELESKLQPAAKK